MAQRHKSLIPLSKDHYEGLLLAQQIRANRIMMIGWPADPEDRARFVARFYDEHLKIHFTAEEESLFPFVNLYVPQASVLVEELVAEHGRIKDLIARFAKPDVSTVEKELSNFSEILERHIRKEERRLFPLFENNAPQEILAQAQEKIQRHYPSQKR